MDTPQNPAKQLLQRIFHALAEGDGRPFRDSLAPDFRWRLPGTNAWSGTYKGREEVLEQLMKPLFAHFATRYTNTATRILAEGNFVVVECQGRVTTHAGQAYDNQYCWVCRVEDGQLMEVNEYMDTALVERVLPR